MKEAFEKIKERLEAEAEEHRKYWDGFDDEDSFGAMNATLRALSIVSEVEAEYGKDINVRGNGWIDVNDRLPKRRELVLVCLKNGYVGEGHFTQDDFWNAQCCMYENVIAWQP